MNPEKWAMGPIEPSLLMQSLRHAEGQLQAAMAEVARLRALGLALLEEWKEHELHMDDEYGCRSNGRTLAEYEKRKAAWEGK